MITNFINTYLYSLIVTAVTILLYSFGRLWIGRKRKKLLKRAKKREVSSTMVGETPDEIDDDKLMAIGLDSIIARFNFIQKVFPIFLFVMWIALMIVPKLSNVPAIYISLIVAFATLVLGVAIKPFVENIIGGVVISLFQPVRIGDTVRIEDRYGVVEEINLTHCILRVWSWKRYVIPNSKMLHKEIENYSMHDKYIWTHIVFYVEPECDLELVENIAKECAFESEFRLADEDPVFWVSDMQKDSVQCWLAAWAPTPPDAWELRCDLRKRLHKKLRSNRIAFQNIRLNSRQYENFTES